MERQLQKIDENYNTVGAIAQKTLLGENKHFLWKTGMQAVVTGSTLASLIISGFGVIPIAFFSGSVIVSNIFSIWAEKIRKKNIKIFFQELNYTLDKINEKLNKELLLKDLLLEIEKKNKDNLRTQIEIENLKFKRSELEQENLRSRIEIEKISLERTKEIRWGQSQLKKEWIEKTKTISNLDSDANQFNDDMLLTSNNFKNNFNYQTTIKITYV